MTQPSFGSVLWECVRSATGYTHSELLELPHQRDAAAIKPCIETLDLVDVSWTDRGTLQKLRDDLETHLHARRAFLEERAKRAARKFATKNFLQDKKYEAALQRDRETAIGAAEVLLRFRRIDFSARGMKTTDAETLGALMHVEELVLTDNDITVLTALPPMATLAILASNEIHRIALSTTSAHTALMALSIAGNCLTSLDFLDQLPNLSALDASYNCICTVEAAACPAVMNHARLTEVNLVGNPATLLPDFRTRIDALLRTSKSVKLLDGQAVSVPGAALLQPPRRLSNEAAGAAATSETNSNNNAQNKSTKPVIAVQFQVLSVRGFSELAARSFDLTAAANKCLGTFYTQSVLDAIAYQTQAAQPNEGRGGKGGGGGAAAAANKAAALAAAQQQQQLQQLQQGGGSGAGGVAGRAPHEAALLQWCSGVTTSLRVHALWLGEERTLQLDDIQQLTNSATTEEQQVALSNAAANLLPPPFLSLGAQAAALAAQKEAHARELAAQQAASAAMMAGGGHHSHHRNKGGDSSSTSATKQQRAGGGAGGAAASKAAVDLAAQKEQALQAAFLAAGAEFVVPDPADRLRPTLHREMMLPLRLGLVLAVMAAPGIPEAELPTATVGWASLSPAELVSGHNTAAVTAKMGCDRATLLTARERVTKLTQQLNTIRASLEKEVQEHAWRRDTEFGGGDAAASNNAKGQQQPQQQRAAGNMPNKGGRNVRGGAGGGPGSPAMGGGGGGGAQSAADSAALEAFIQSQQQGRKRAEETYKRLTLEMAMLGVLEALDRNAGLVSVDARFSLCKPGFRSGDDEKSGKQQANAAGDGTAGNNGNNAGAGGNNGGAADGGRANKDDGAKRRAAAAAGGKKAAATRK